jgi:hypothetical protein
VLVVDEQNFAIEFEQCIQASVTVFIAHVSTPDCQ